MNQLKGVRNFDAEMDGIIALVRPITDAFQNGCFVMAKTIAATEVMSYQRIVNEKIMELENTIGDK